MNCGICRQGQTKPRKGTVTPERNEMTLVIKGVPAEVCQNCGDTYFDEVITDHLLKLGEAAALARVQVDVRQYVAA